MDSSTKLRQELRSLGDETLERMVYLVGSARGGTSLSLHLIGAHPRLMGFHGPSHFINQVWRYRKVVHDRLLRVIFWANALVDRRKLDDHLSEEQSRAANALIGRAFARLDFRALHDLYPLLYALDPGRDRKPADYLAWFDKGNDANGIEELASHYPRARFLFIVRDPRAAIATLSRVRDEHSGSTGEISLPNILAECIYWRNLTQRCMRFAARYPDRAIIYSFERLITDPRAVLSRIFAFLDLPALDQTAMTGLIEGIGYGSHWGGSGIGLKTEPITRWRSLLKPEAADLICEVCGPTARKLGYDMPAPARGRGWLGSIRLVGGATAKAVTLSKLAYLAARETPLRRLDTGANDGGLLWSPSREVALQASMAESAAAS